MSTQEKSPCDAERLRREQPIAVVISGYGIELRPSGRILVGRCPFHRDEGRPNLYVYPETNSFYCFRCAIGGDVIDFVRWREKLGFSEVCRRLAARPASPAMTPPRGSSTEGQRRPDRLTLAEQLVMNAACTLYRNALWREPRALAYLRKRGIPDWVTRQCSLGYADGHSLVSHFGRRWQLPVAIGIGLGRRSAGSDSSGSFREFFAGRIVVPEIRHGQCQWFIGRALEDKTGLPKYLALPGERPVIGLERAAGKREVFLCEGVFDYLTAVSWGLPACSPCGTHLPVRSLGFLARAAAVYGVLDADAAGEAGAARFGVALGKRWRPLRLPEGCDLNDLAQRPGGRGAFFRLLAEARAAGKRKGPPTDEHGNGQFSQTPPTSRGGSAIDDLRVE